jgi:hypothetical protein
MKGTVLIYLWVVTGMDAIGSNWLNKLRNARGYAHYHRTVFSPFLQEPCRAALGSWAFIRAQASACFSLRGCKARKANECSPKLGCQPTFHNGKKTIWTASERKVRNTGRAAEEKSNLAL